MDERQYSVSVFNGTSEATMGFASGTRSMSWNELQGLVCSTAWAPGVFNETSAQTKGGMLRTGMHRLNSNLKSMELLVLDIDDGCSIAEASFIFGKYQAFIATTRSHLKEKNGVVAERFRVVIPLAEAIHDDATFKATWHQARELCPAIDRACKDAARFYFASAEVVEAWDGKAFPVSAPAALQPATPIVTRELEEGARGELAKATAVFALDGAPQGEWHHALFKAAIDLKQNLYTEEEAISYLSRVHVLDAKDVFQIGDVYANREPKHPPRLADEKTAAPAPETSGPLSVSASSFLEAMFSSLSDPFQTRGQPTGLTELDEMLGGGKRLGELTVTCALAKSGKSSLYAFFMHQWLKRGIGVGYASREMQPGKEVMPNLLSLEFQHSVLKRAVESGGVSEGDKRLYVDAVAKWPLTFAKGTGEMTLEQFDRWTDELLEQGTRYVFIDHLHICMADLEQWEKTGPFVRGLRELAAKKLLHIDLIVQPGKVDGKLTLNSLRGGAAINQGLDNLFLFERMSTENVSKLVLERARYPLARSGHVYLEYEWRSRGFGIIDYDEDGKEVLRTKRPTTPLMDSFQATRRRAGEGFKSKQLVGV
jgi:hypothetical protein